MTPQRHRIGLVSAMAVVGYFTVFTAVCWFLDLAFPGKLATQTRAHVAFDAGVMGGLFAIRGSVYLWRSHRRFAVLGLASCFLWLVWILLPRL